ncbi:hypothetical protein MMC25_006533 [Agyrium rufum]|nr:hypothetical protein [Agyrium rufum]
MCLPYLIIYPAKKKPRRPPSCNPPLCPRPIEIVERRRSCDSIVFEIERDIITIEPRPCKKPQRCPPKPSLRHSSCDKGKAKKQPPPCSERSSSKGLEEWVKGFITAEELECARKARGSKANSPPACAPVPTPAPQPPPPAPRPRRDSDASFSSKKSIKELKKKLGDLTGKVGSLEREQQREREREKAREEQECRDRERKRIKEEVRAKHETKKEKEKLEALERERERERVGERERERKREKERLREAEREMQIQRDRERARRLAFERYCEIMRERERDELERALREQVRKDAGLAERESVEREIRERLRLGRIEEERRTWEREKLWMEKERERDRERCERRRTMCGTERSEVLERVCVYPAVEVRAGVGACPGTSGGGPSRGRLWEREGAGWDVWEERGQFRRRGGDW